MLANLTSRIIAFIVIGLSFLVALIWYLTAYQSAQTTIADLNSQITGLESQKQIGENAQRNVIRLCGVVQGLEAEKINFLNSLPSSEQFSKLLTNVRTQIASNKGQLNSITRQLGATGGATIPAGIRAVNLNLALEGTYSSLYGILVSLEQQQRFLNVDNLSFAQNASSNVDNAGQASNPKLTSNLILAAYVYDDPNRNTQSTINPICTGLPTSEPQTTPTGTNPTTPTNPATPAGTGEAPR
jgi:type IV pilus assembly protein PilO